MLVSDHIFGVRHGNSIHLIQTRHGKRKRHSRSITSFCSKSEKMGTFTCFFPFLDHNACGRVPNMGVFPLEKAAGAYTNCKNAACNACSENAKGSSAATRYAYDSTASFYWITASDRLCKTCPISASIQTDCRSISRGQAAWPWLIQA